MALHTEIVGCRRLHSMNRPGGLTLAIAVWKDGSFVSDVYANRSTLSGGWGAAEVIDDTSVDSAGNTVVGVDSAGNAIGAWIQSNGAGNTLWASRFTPSLGWGTPQPIDDGLGLATSGPELAVEPNGNAVAVWQQRDGFRNDIWANHFATGTGWGTPVLVEHDDTGGAESPKVAVDPDGNAIAVWFKTGTSPCCAIWGNRYTPAGGWETAIAIDSSTVNLNPHVAMDPGGNAVVVWLYFTRVKSRRFTQAAGWGTPSLIGGPTAQSWPRVALDANGNATAVWFQDDGTATTVWSNRYE
jgi:hypothetical protein